MRLFTQEYLKYVRDADGEIVYDSFDEPVLRTKEGLKTLLAMLQTSEPCDERDKNIDEVTIALNGGVRYTPKSVMDDIKAGLPDTSDMGGNY